MSGLLSMILGRPKNTELAGFHVQTSVYGSPIPIVYGKMRIAGNLIHMPAVPVLASQGGGKSSKGSNAGNNYTAPIVIALCEGAIVGIAFVWRDKDDHLTYTGNYDVTGWGLATGTAAQSPWAFLSSDYPAEAVPYQSTAYVDHEAASLPNDSMPQFSWEVIGFLSFDHGGGIDDASPADVIPDFLTNARYGVGWDSAQIGDTTDFEDYCAAAGLFMSPAVDNQRPAADWINDWCEIANTGLVWSDGVLKFKPYGDVPLSGNGHTYTPNTTPLYDLTDRDFLAPAGTDPIVVTRRDAATTPNQVTVQYRDRDFDYNSVPVNAQDQLAIEANGLIALPPLQLHAITTADVAQAVAQVRLQREQNIPNTFSFKLGWRYSLLEPMDLVTLTDAELGLNRTPVRIVEISDEGDEKGFDVIAEDWPLGTASATQYTTPGANGTGTNTNVDPGNTTTPVIFEGPTPLQSAPLEVWIGASGGNDWGGCEVWISVDNTSFEKMGTIRGKAIFGLLTATLATNAAYPSIDTTHTLSVDLTSSGGALVAQSQANFDNLTPLCYLGGREFVDYRDLSLVGPFNYDLSHLYRGLYDSTVASHASTTAFVFCDMNILRVPWPLGYIGQVLHFKFPAFNIYGAALQDIASISSVSHTVGEDPVIPGSGGAIPQGTISIDASAFWTASVDGPDGTQSFRYAYSTGGFPSDAAVLAGTIVAGRTFTIAAGPLSAGQTIFLSVIAFSGAGATGTATASAHMRATYVAQTSIPQGTVAIDQDGYWNATADGPTGTNSFRWLSSTSSYPADATVIASGTVEASTRSFSAINQGPLAFGETIYITIVAFTDTAGLVGPGSAIHLRGAYQSYAATKTAAYSPAGYVLVPDPAQSTVTEFSQGTDGALWCAALAPYPADYTSVWMFPVIADGVTITEVDVELYDASVDANAPAGVSFIRVISNTATSLGSTSATAGLGWQTWALSLSESTSGRSYYIRAQFIGGTSAVAAGEERLGNMYITYTSPDPSANL